MAVIDVYDPNSPGGYQDATDYSQNPSVTGAQSGTNSATTGFPGGTAGPNPPRPHAGGRTPPGFPKSPTNPYQNPNQAVPKFPTPTAPGIPPSAPAPGTTPPPAAPKFQGVDKNKILSFLQQNYGAASTAALRAAFPRLIAEGLIPEDSRLEQKDTADEIYIPGYGWVDFMGGADSGHPDPNWAFHVGGGPGEFFNDPIGSWFGGIVQQLIEQLQAPRSLDPHVQESYDILKQLTGGGFHAAPFQAPDISEYRTNTRNRINELNAEPFSANEEQAQRVKAFDNIERSRAVAIQQTRERLAAMGHAPTSGTVEAAIQQVNQSYDALRAQNENSLLLYGIDERQRRHTEASSLEQQIADRILKITGMQEQAREADMQAQSAASGRGLSAAQTLAALSQYIGNFMDPTSRIMQILQAAGTIPELENIHFNQASGQVE